MPRQKRLHNSFSISHWVLQLHKASTNEELRKHYLTIKEALHQQHIVDALYSMLGECPELEKTTRTYYSLTWGVKTCSH